MVPLRNAGNAWCQDHYLFINFKNFLYINYYISGLSSSAELRETWITTTYYYLTQYLFIFCFRWVVEMYAGMVDRNARAPQE